MVALPVGSVLAPRRFAGRVWVLTGGLVASLRKGSLFQDTMRSSSCSPWVTTAHCVYSVCSLCFSFQELMPPEGP